MKNASCPPLKNFTKNKDLLPKKPELSMSKMDRVERGFMIRMFFPEGNINVFYDIQPELMQNIVNRWDTYKTKSTHQG